MSDLRELLVEQLQDITHAEGQLLEAIPKMAQAAQHPKLKEAFEKHLAQTQGQVDRLRRVFELLGETAQPKPCKGMMGLIAEGEEVIQEGSNKEPLAADLALIAAAQKVEHYEISAYGTARGLARQLQEMECARLLSHSLGEEETTDYLLTSISDPLIQQAALEDSGASVNLESVSSESEKRPPARKQKASQKTERGAA
jgi:Mn-containing catalase